MNGGDPSTLDPLADLVLSAEIGPALSAAANVSEEF
jgi:hypothetical protein